MTGVTKTKVRRVYIKSKRSFRQRSRGLEIPLAIVAGMLPTGIKVWEARGGGASGMTREAGRILTGFDFWNGTFNWRNLQYGLFPMVGGLMVHKLVGQRLGVNRVLRQANIPFIRI